MAYIPEITLNLLILQCLVKPRHFNYLENVESLKYITCWGEAFLKSSSIFETFPING